MLATQDIIIPVAKHIRRRHLAYPQSKHGCLTCRARRKKCDEQKPTCKRCTSTGRICEGYRTDERGKSLHVASLPRPLSSGFLGDPADARFSQLGYELLGHQVSMDSFAVSTTVWTVLLPQLSMTVPCVNAAAICLGSVYDSQVLRNNSVNEIDRLDRHYRQALSLLQTEIASPIFGRTSVFLTCVLPAGVEVLQRRLINAMIHLRGAFQIITTYTSEVNEREALYRIAQALDIQTASYALSQPPDLPSPTIASTYNTSTIPYALSPSIDDMHSEHLAILHNCYQYCFTASKYKYVHPSKIPQHIVLEQGRLISHLSQWKARLDHDDFISPLESSEDLISRSCSRLVMRLQCVSATIYLSSILNPFEKGYDSLTHLFEMVTNGATTLLHQSPRGGLNNPRNRFRIISSLAQPLYMTSTKCRKRDIRQESARLLGETGREGPWSGLILARVATRIAELEDRQKRKNGDIPERARIHGTGIRSEGAIQDGLVEVQFSRCVDVNILLASGDWESQSNWEIWMEKI